MFYRKSKHIGILACSSEGAALCYRTICLESQKSMQEHGHPEISLHGHCLASYMDNIEPTKKWDKVAELMQSSYDKLCENGAQIIVCPDNTIHEAYGLVSQKTDVTWLHIAQVVADKVQEMRCRKVGILGTQFLMEGPVYPDALETIGIVCTIPERGVRKELNRIIFEELVNGKFTQESRDYYSAQIDDFKSQGCDAVILGCTEIPLLISENDSSLPIIDSTRELARAAIKTSLESPVASR